MIVCRSERTGVGALDAAREIGVCVLAGGEATRLPGKLSLDAGDVPLLARVVRNVSPGRDTWLSTNGPLPAGIAHYVGALPQVVDPDYDDAPSGASGRRARGPLAGLLSAFRAMPQPWIFVVAGDAPFVDAAFIDMLATYVDAGDNAGSSDDTSSTAYDAVVPMHDGIAEPLAALYRRDAFLREAPPVLAASGGPRAVIDRLRTRFVTVHDEHAFANVNTPADYARLREVLA